MSLNNNAITGNFPNFPFPFYSTTRLAIISMELYIRT